MNAYELANKMEQLAGHFHNEAINMLRQQADRIAELEKSSMAWYEAGKFVSPQIKELSDDEIWELADIVLENSNVIGFARAILKKASER